MSSYHVSYWFTKCMVYCMLQKIISTFLQGFSNAHVIVFSTILTWNTNVMFSSHSGACPQLTSVTNLGRFSNDRSFRLISKFFALCCFPTLSDVVVVVVAVVVVVVVVFFCF